VRNLWLAQSSVVALRSNRPARLKPGILTGPVGRLAPAQRVFLCVVLTPSEALEEKYQCMAESAKVEAHLPTADPLRVSV
jgi:hypothetical protein